MEGKNVAWFARTAAAGRRQQSAGFKRPREPKQPHARFWTDYSPVAIWYCAAKFIRTGRIAES